MVRRNFIPRNDGFICDACGKNVPPASGTFRNHCPFCLTSKHVDDTVPGDRDASCHGLMRPIAAEGTDPDFIDIIHRCEKCEKTIRNRRASDDNTEKLFSLTAQSH